MSGADNNTTPTRKRNNMMLGLVLAAFVTLVFSITIAKMMAGQNMEATDHVRRPALEISE
ncbi:MAG: cytochrome C oxidase assembly protein [Rhodobacteraceae bacterium]|nr:MAG: cytochrome C oxidase assembly protein [Paracoccaceae bacterium]